MIAKESALPADYGRWIQMVKDRVRNAQLRTMVAVNVEQLLLYWDIGHDILERQKNEGWGAKVIQKMSEDLCAEFPTNNGFSIRNLKYMRAFAAAWPNRKLIVQAPLAQLAWYSQIALIEKLETREDRLGYAPSRTRRPYVGWLRLCFVVIIVFLTIRFLRWLIKGIRLGLVMFVVVRVNICVI